MRFRIFFKYLHKLPVQRRLLIIVNQKCGNKQLEMFALNIVLYTGIKTQFF